MTRLPDPADIRAQMNLDGAPEATRIVVAMSGGVDSSVAAGLLKHAGYDVVGVTLQLYDHGAAVHRSGACCAGQDIHDARRVADILGIPHYVLDYEQRFREAVIETFADSYVQGETPVPCISCNQQIKFKDMLATAKDLGAHALATGHYISRKIGDAGPELHQATDLSRDQSYFLFATTPEQLEFLRFPLGEIPKQAIREMAEELGLPVAAKSDSQDICFVPSGHYSNVVEKLHPEASAPGDIVHTDGRVLGKHGGIFNYTVGQRRGIGLAVGEPLYVIKLDAARRQVIVGPREELLAARIMLRDVSWIGDEPIADFARDEKPVHVRVRSTREPQPAHLVIEESGGIAVVLDAGEEGVAPGQACVFYASGNLPARVLGGGWITGIENAGRAMAGAAGATARQHTELEEAAG